MSDDGENEKGQPVRAALSKTRLVLVRSGLGRSNVDDASSTLDTEFHLARDQCKQCVVAAAANADAGVEVGSALAHENLARADDLTAVDPGLPDGYSAEHAVTEQALRDAESLAGRVFGDSPQQIREQEDELVQRWRDAPDSFEMWTVRDEKGDVVCSGRVDVVDATDFAGLWGGACDPAHRGRGLYRDLVAQRARLAQARGKHLIQVDCSEDSRPILERAGLTPITTVTAAIWKRA